MWKLNDKVIKEGKAWTDDDGVQHPANWNIWSDEEKKSAGLTYEEPVDNSFDNRFYWAKNIERKLNDVLVVDENDQKVIDPMTGEQMVQEGLKTQYIAQTKQTANDMLSKTDWMIVRNAEKSTAIPEATTKFRDSVRTKCAEIETAINACSSLAQFMKLFEAEKLGDNPPMYDWPTE